MKRKSNKLKKKVKRLEAGLKKEDKELHHTVEYIKKHLDKIWGHVHKTNNRLQELEIRSDLLTRLLTTLCIEKLGMRLGAVRRMIRQVEKDAMAESQIAHLKHLFSLEAKQGTKKRPGNTSKKG